MSGDQQLAARFEPDLLAGERILWAGRPDARRLLTKADLWLLPFGIVWTSFVIGFFIQANARSSPDPVFRIVPAFFLLVGFYFVVGRFVVLRYRKRRTAYAVTDRRVLVLTEVFRRSLKSAWIERLPTIEKTVRSDGSGSIRFGTSHPFATMYENTGLEFFGAAYGGTAPSFVDIPDVHFVYRLVNDRAARGSQS